MAHPTFTCSGQLREASFLDYGTPQSISPYDPELFFALDFDDDWNLEDDRRDPLMDWIELDGLTLIDHPHITAGGSLATCR